MAIIHQQISQLGAGLEFASILAELIKNPKMLDEMKKEVAGLRAMYEGDIEAANAARADIAKLAEAKAKAEEAIADAEAAQRKAEEAEKKAAAQRAALSADKAEAISAKQNANKAMAELIAVKAAINQDKDDLAAEQKDLLEKKAQYEQDVAAFEIQKQQLRSLVG